MIEIGSRTTGQVNRVRLTTGGSGYTSAPSVSFSGGGGTGAAAVAHMAGTSVQSIQVVNGGTGYTSDPAISVSGNAEAVAYAHTASLRPASFIRSRFRDVYVYDGMGRGLKWDGQASTTRPAGIQKPASGPSLAAVSSANGSYVTKVEVVDGGSLYTSPPVVSISGGSPSSPAKAIAFVENGLVSGFEVREGGAGYQSQPTVTVSGGNASGASLSVGVIGSISGISLLSGGTGYSAPTVSVATSNGLTGFNATVAVVDGVIQSVSILSGGTGATAEPTLLLNDASGSGASLEKTVSYRVSAVTVQSAGSGFFEPPGIVFTPDSSDTTARAAAATASVSDGQIQAVTVTSGGRYSQPPAASVGGEEAKARAVLSPNMRGKYKCAIRYIDDTSPEYRGPLPSSISELVEVNLDDGYAGIDWTLSHQGLDDHVSAVELWRTTADQQVILFKVATIQRTAPEFSGTYRDTINDDDLRDTNRDGYALMPVTLPSGQVNARRFDVPPGHYAVATSFQDRVWFAVDTTGRSVNSLMFSEIDEPESVPATNEIVLQESITDTDAIVGLVPLGSMLLICQSRHLYSLQYVAQPVIDASIMLVAYRGILNPRCYAILGGAAFIADSNGLYAYDGNQTEPASVPVDNLWRDGTIDLSKADKFFMSADESTKTVRFFYCGQSDSEPQTALCYCVGTKSWWTETFAKPLTAASTYYDSERALPGYGSSEGVLYKPTGDTDDGDPISYSLKTGNFPLNEDGSRGIGVLYTPTENDADLLVETFYNGSGTRRDNAIQTSRGDGFEAVEAGGQLNMNLAKSHLQTSNGFARARYTGRLDERSSGADRHLAIRLSGVQATSGQQAVIHAVGIEGAG